MFNNNKNNISGIHNYCDRWCERCAFTTRCAAFEGTHDEDKEAFMEKIMTIFLNIKEDLEKYMIEWGIPAPPQAELDDIGLKMEQTLRSRFKTP